MGTGIFIYSLILSDPKSHAFENYTGVVLDSDADSVRGCAINLAMCRRPGWHLAGQSVLEIEEDTLTEAGFREVLPPDPDRIQRITGQLREHGGVDSSDLEWLVEQAVQVREERPPSEDERQKFHDLMGRITHLQEAMARIANLRYSKPDSLSQALTIADTALKSDGTGAETPSDTFKFQGFGLDTLVRLLWIRDNPGYNPSSFEHLADPTQLASYQREVTDLLHRAGIGVTSG